MPRTSQFLLVLVFTLFLSDAAYALSGWQHAFVRTRTNAMKDLRIVRDAQSSLASGINIEVNWYRIAQLQFIRAERGQRPALQSREFFGGALISACTV